MDVSKHSPWRFLRLSVQPPGNHSPIHECPARLPAFAPYYHRNTLTGNHRINSFWRTTLTSWLEVPRKRECNLASAISLSFCDSNRYLLKRNLRDSTLNLCWSNTCDVWRKEFRAECTLRIPIHSLHSRVSELYLHQQQMCCQGRAQLSCRNMAGLSPPMSSLLIQQTTCHHSINSLFCIKDSVICHVIRCKISSIVSILGWLLDFHS